MSDYLLDRHRLVLKGLGGALTLVNDPETTSRLVRILANGLSPEERAWLLHVLLDAVEPDDAVPILDDYFASLEEGPPLPALDAFEDSAQWWASLASVPELRAYLAACFVRLPPRDQAEFLAHASRRIAA